MTGNNWIAICNGFTKMLTIYPSRTPAPSNNRKYQIGMDETSENHMQTTRAKKGEPSSFQSIFFPSDRVVDIRVPDYQRAYSWEDKQIKLFIQDLAKYHGSGQGYYFGHFIAQDLGDAWEIVDGQQRITTFVLFLMVCRVLSPSSAHAFSLINRFRTVSYDAGALETIGRDLGAFLNKNRYFDERKPPPDEHIINDLSLPSETFTRSQRRMVLALLLFHKSFKEHELHQDKISGYIEAVLTAHCSHHLTQDKSVAVNIFEMQNTRGIPLTTLEIIKAMLMKFCYDHGGADRDAKVQDIQREFGEVYGMEERMAARSFRGKMALEQLLPLHLRVVDDGKKETAQDLHSPATNANADALLKYVDSRLHFMDANKTESKRPEVGVEYALNLAKEFKKSMRIISETLHLWDEEDPLVGDVLILDQELSCQFFLIICRCLESKQDKVGGRIGKDSLLLWEKLLFTRDFHNEYFNLKGVRDDFPALFVSCRQSENRITEVIKNYLTDGFRPDLTKAKGLQSVVTEFLKDNKDNVLNNAFNWRKDKMIYVIYKYEISKGAKLREVMKGTPSVEHVLPQEWQWEWIEGASQVPGKLSEEERVKWRNEVGTFINGIGNLLLITRGDNTALGNNHPADKTYEKYYGGGSYEEHNLNRDKWRHPREWAKLIRERGDMMFEFMLTKLVDASPREGEGSTYDN